MLLGRNPKSVSGGAIVIAIYSRKSKFTGKGESIENQIELCKQYIKMHWKEDVENQIAIYEDEGFSGKTLERPKFKDMMKDARKGKLSSIIVYRLDRISRNIGDFAQLIDQLNDMNIAFVSIKEQFDTSSPMGRAMMYIASVFSQLERETIILPRFIQSCLYLTASATPGISDETSKSPTQTTPVVLTRANPAI